MATMEDEKFIYVCSIIVIFSFLLLLNLINILMSFDEADSLDYNNTIIYVIILATALLSTVLEMQNSIFVFPAFIMLSLFIIACDKKSINIFS